MEAEGHIPKAGHNLVCFSAEGMMEHIPHQRLNRLCRFSWGLVSKDTETFNRSHATLCTGVKCSFGQLEGTVPQKLTGHS